jgi:hypothetical protein
LSFFIAEVYRTSGANATMEAGFQLVVPMMEPPPDAQRLANGRQLSVVPGLTRQCLMQDTPKMKRTLALILLPAALAAATVAHAHNAICSCFENDDRSITCEGGFSDGAKAVGVPIQVLDQAGKVLIQGVMDKNSSFRFARPKVAFRVKFSAGEGHIITIDGRDIEK